MSSVAGLRYGYVQWAARLATVLVFSACVALYGLPLAVLLAMVAVCVFCPVSYVSYTHEGQPWRRSLSRAYDKLFRVVYAHPRPTNPPVARRRPVEKAEAQRAVPVSLECHKEAQKMVQLVMRDFVLEWYEHMTDDSDFPEDCQKILEHVALEINLRLHRVNLREVVCELLAGVLPYLEAVSSAGTVEYKGVSVCDVEHERCVRRFEENSAVAHRALRSAETEARHYRQLLDAVIQSAVPDEYRNCDVVCVFLREILLPNLLEPLLGLLCDPNFLNEAIPVVLEKANPTDVQVILSKVEEENEQLANTLRKGRLIQAHRRPPNMRRFHSVSEHFSPTVKTIPMGVVEEREDVSAGENPYRGEELTATVPPAHPQPPLPFEENVGPSPAPLRRVKTLNSPSRDRRRVSLQPHSPSLSPRLMRRQTIGGLSSTHHKRTADNVASSHSLDMPDFSVAQELEPDMVFINLPPIFATRYVHIDSSGSTHIGYIFKFPKHMLSSADLQELQVPAAETHLESVKRYSDFKKFHQQLQRLPLAIYAKGLDLPDPHSFANVMSKLPFTSRDLDPTSLLERKQGLEKYIQSVCSIQPILESEIFHDFLLSGIHLLREANVLQQTHRHRKKTLLTMMKGHSEEDEEAQRLPRRPMVSVISSYLNTQLPLPCRKLHSTSSLRSGRSTPPTSLPPPPSPIARATESHTPTHREVKDESDRVQSLPDFFERSKLKTGPNLTEKQESNNEILTIGDVANLLTETESSDTQPPCLLELPFVCRLSDTPPFTQNSPATLGRSAPPCRTLISLFPRAKTHLLRLYMFVLRYVAMTISILHLCSQPVSPLTLATLTRRQEREDPLSNVLLALGTEAARMHCEELWVTDHSTQLATLTLLGGTVDRFLFRELTTVVTCEENWVRALYHLRHTLWVDGREGRSRTDRERLTEDEREGRKREAVESFKKFLPNFLPYIVGPVGYNHTVTHCIECLQNPKINRHFLLRLIDILLPRIVTELHTPSFQKRLSHLRTLTTHHIHRTATHSRSLASNHVYSSKR